MREIKFRAWLIKEKVMVDVAHLQVKQPRYITARRKSGGIFFRGRYELMQYTGLKDKNGVEIYEGDICRFNRVEEEPIFFHGIAEMASSETGWGWKIVKNENAMGEDYWDSSSFWNDDYEVIGNIYENPELLK